MTDILQLGEIRIQNAFGDLANIQRLSNLDSERMVERFIQSGATP